jgi:hypothetical protein
MGHGVILNLTDHIGRIYRRRVERTVSGRRASPDGRSQPRKLFSQSLHILSLIDWADVKEIPSVTLGPLRTNGGLLGAFGQQVVVCSEGEERKTRACRSWRAEYTTKQNSRWSTQANGHINRAGGKRAATTGDVTAAAEVRFGAESSIAETAQNRHRTMS